MKKLKMTSQERAWILYDVGNSAFVLLCSTLIPIYFNTIAGSVGLSSADYLAYWGYAASIVTVIGVLLGPVLGTLADTKGYKKPLFLIALFLGFSRLCFDGVYPVMDSFSFDFCCGKGWVFLQFGVLRFHALRCY